MISDVFGQPLKKLTTHYTRANAFLIITIVFLIFCVRMYTCLEKLFFNYLTLFFERFLRSFLGFLRHTYNGIANVAIVPSVSCNDDYWVLHWGERQFFFFVYFPSVLNATWRRIEPQKHKKPYWFSRRKLNTITITVECKKGPARPSSFGHADSEWETRNFTVTGARPKDTDGHGRCRWSHNDDNTIL